MNDKKNTILNIILLVINIVLIGFNCYKLSTYYEEKVNNANNVSVNNNYDERYISKIGSGTVQVYKSTGWYGKGLAFTVIVDEEGDAYFDPNYEFSFGQFNENDFGIRTTHTISKYNDGESFDCYKLNVNNIRNVYMYSALFGSDSIVDVVLIDNDNVASIIQFVADYDNDIIYLIDVLYKIKNDIVFAKPVYNDEDIYYELIDINGEEYIYINELYMYKELMDNNTQISGYNFTAKNSKNAELFEKYTNPLSHKGLLYLDDGNVYLEIYSSVQWMFDTVKLNNEFVEGEKKFSNDYNEYYISYKLPIENIKHVMATTMESGNSGYYVLISNDNNISILSEGYTSETTSYDIKFYKNIIDNIVSFKETTDGLVFIDSNNVEYIFHET